MLSSRKESINPYSINVGCMWHLPSKKYSMERGQKVALQWRKHNHAPSPVIKVDINSHVMLKECRRSPSHNS